MQLVALEAQEAHLFAADPRLVPGHLDLGGDLVALDAIAPGIGDHRPERREPLLVGLRHRAAVRRH